MRSELNGKKCQGKSHWAQCVAIQYWNEAQKIEPPDAGPRRSCAHRETKDE